MLILYGRPYCHLCAEMETAVRECIAGTGVDLRTIDVDTDPDLEARFGDRVPVLTWQAEEICHYHFEPAHRAALLRKIG